MLGYSRSFQKIWLEYKYFELDLIVAVLWIEFIQCSCVPGVGEYCLCNSVVYLQSDVTFDQVLIIQLWAVFSSGLWTLQADVLQCLPVVYEALIASSYLPYWTWRHCAFGLKHCLVQIVLIGNQRVCLHEEAVCFAGLTIRFCS